MAESLSDTVKDAAETAKEAALTRFSGAFTAYIATSWLAFNWSNIAFLFMSNAPVEQRLQAIYGQDNLYWQYLVAPISVGFFLSIAMPAMNAFVLVLTARFSALSEVSQERARAKVNAELAVRREQKTIIDARIDNLGVQKNHLLIEIEELEKKLREIKSRVGPHENAVCAIVQRTCKIINELTTMKRSNEEGNLVTYEQINELFSPEEMIKAQKWYQSVCESFGLELAKSLVEEPANLFADKDLIIEALQYAANRPDPTPPPPLDS